MVPLVRNSLPKTSSVRVGFMYRIPSLQDDKKNLIVKENYFYLELFSLKSSKEFLNFSFFHRFFVPQEFDLLTPGRDTYIHNAVPDSAEYVKNCNTVYFAKNAKQSVKKNSKEK